MEHKFNENNQCPVCDSKKAEHYISALDHNVSMDVFHITSCIECGLKFTNPRPTEDTIGKYYLSESYVSHSGTKKGLINSLYHIVRKYQLKKKMKMITKFSSVKTLLDIGCGTGEFLRVFSKIGWDVSGIEPDKKARCYAEKNYELFIKETLKDYPNKPVSVITMWHALEHVYNLKEDLIKISSLLIDKGYLIIAVPNCNSYDAKHYKEHWAAYDLPIHLYHFNKTDIENLCSQINFKLIEIKPLKFDSFYISMLSEKKKKGSLAKALFIGLKSNLKARHKVNHSSLIYILQKN